VLVTIEPRKQRPAWLRPPAPVGDNYRQLKQLVEDLQLHTVCESAACPNIGAGVNIEKAATAAYAVATIEHTYRIMVLAQSPSDKF